MALHNNPVPAPTKQIITEATAAAAATTAKTTTKYPHLNESKDPWVIPNQQVTSKASIELNQLPPWMYILVTTSMCNQQSNVSPL